MNTEQILKDTYGFTIPTPPAPGGIYSPVRRTGNLLYISGQTPMVDGSLQYAGVVGKDLSVEEGQQAARLCALNLLAVLKNHLDGDLSKVKQLVQLVAYVRSAEGFGQQPQVINGASQLFLDIFGEAGRASRLALGTSELPGGASVEIAVIVEV